MEVFVGNTVNFVLKTGVDLTGYTDIRMRFRRADGTTGEWIPSVHTIEDTWMEYTTLISDLDQSGTWAIQAYAAAAGVSLHGKWVEFVVYTPIKLIYTKAINAIKAGFGGSLSSS
jgi:hypothetical protein